MSEKKVNEDELQEALSEEMKEEIVIEKEEINPVIESPKDGSDKKTGTEEKKKNSKSAKKTSDKKKSAKVKFTDKEVDAIVTENADLTIRNKELDNKYLRLLAEVENYKKRSSKDLSRSREMYKENILSGLLSIMDDMDRVSEHTKKDELPEADALLMIRSKLLTYMGQYDVKPFVSLNETFDADKHDAMLTRNEEDKEDQLILEEFEKGYVIGDKVLRHARVVVNVKE